MKRIGLISMFVAILAQSGCGVVALVTTPTQYEKKIAAEYNLIKEKDAKVLVLVKEPSWVGAGANLRYYLTGELNKSLVKKVKIAAENVVRYQVLADLRAKQEDFAALWPEELGRAFKADYVLLVRIGSFVLTEIDEMGLYRGSLNAQAVLVDTATGKKVWPSVEDSKIIMVGYEAEKGDRTHAITKLAAAAAHCTTRYFYDCPKDKFKIREDMSYISREKWGEDWDIGGF